MGHTFHATPAEAIIYENTDDLPRSDPFTYRSRVVFYSGFRYPARVRQLSGTVTFSAAVNDQAVRVIVNESVNIGAHGVNGIPLVEGRWLGLGTGGANVPMIGSVPVQQIEGDPSWHRFTRFATLGADATNVYLHSMLYRSTFGQNYPSVTLSYSVDVFDWVLQ